jgi:apolipoprotein N-acyltransferase
LLLAWRSAHPGGRLAAASGLAMLVAQGVALGYFFPFNPPGVALVVLVQASVASLPWLVLAGLRHWSGNAATRLLWWLPGLWLVNDWAWSFLPEIVPTPLGGALGGMPALIKLYAWTGLWGGTLGLLALQVWLVQDRFSLAQRLGGALALLCLASLAGNWLQWRDDASAHASAEVALIRTGPRNIQDDIHPWFDRAMILTARAARSGAQLTVWPEGVLPAPLIGQAEHPLHRALLAILARSGVPLLFGHDEAAGRFLYNSATLLRPGERLGNAQTYHKRWLLPEKEGGYFFGMGKRWMRAGETSHPLAFAARDGTLRRVGPLICYEALVSAAAVAQVRAGAQVLVVIAHDAEFQNTPALWQLDAQTQVRAVETGRAVIRVATQGALQHFDAHGREVLRDAGGAPGFSIVRPEFRTALTFYVRHPDWLPLLVLTLGTMALLLRVLRWKSPQARQCSGLCHAASRMR